MDYKQFQTTYSIFISFKKVDKTKASPSFVQKAAFGRSVMVKMLFSEQNNLLTWGALMFPSSVASPPAAYDPLVILNSRSTRSTDGWDEHTLNTCTCTLRSDSSFNLQTKIHKLHNILYRETTSFQVHERSSRDYNRNKPWPAIAYASSSASTSYGNDLTLR